MKASRIEMHPGRTCSYGCVRPGPRRIGGVGRRGFTLLEVVAAIFIFLVGVVGVISLFASATVFHKAACDKTFCALLIEQVVPDIERRLSTGGLRDANGKLKAIRDGSIEGNDRYGYEADFVEQGMPGHSLIRAKILVTWKDKGMTRGERFDHVFRPGPAYDDFVKDLCEGTGFRKAGEALSDSPGDNTGENK